MPLGLASFELAVAKSGRVDLDRYTHQECTSARNVLVPHVQIGAATLQLLCILPHLNSIMHSIAVVDDASHESREAQRQADNDREQDHPT